MAQMHSKGQGASMPSPSDYSSESPCVHQPRNPENLVFVVFLCKFHYIHVLSRFVCRVCVCVCVCERTLSCLVISDSWWPHGLEPARLLCPWDCPSKNTGVACHFLLQGIFQTQGLNQHPQHLLHWQEPPGKPLSAPWFPLKKHTFCHYLLLPYGPEELTSLRLQECVWPKPGQLEHSVFPPHPPSGAMRGWENQSEPKRLHPEAGWDRKELRKWDKSLEVLSSWYHKEKSLPGIESTRRRTQLNGDVRTLMMSSETLDSTLPETHPWTFQWSELLIPFISQDELWSPWLLAAFHFP